MLWVLPPHCCVVSAQDGQVIRVSFSSLFKEFKAMAMWLQFPFSCEAKTPRKGDTETGHKWGRPRWASAWWGARSLRAVS